jgi:hypothetical protein
MVRREQAQQRRARARTHHQTLHRNCHCYQETHP